MGTELLALAAHETGCASIGRTVDVRVAFGEEDAPPSGLRAVAVQVSRRAVAAILFDGDVVTWGRANAGGDSNAVQDRLRNVVCIQSTDWAFAAVRHDGAVIAWGHEEWGGYLSDNVQEQLFNVQCIQATSRAFAAIRADGCAVAWGAAIAVAMLAPLLLRWLMFEPFNPISTLSLPWLVGW